MSAPAESFLRWITFSIIAAAVGWLALSAVLVDIEYYDGLSALCNARYFLGRSSFYIFDRGPLMAWLLMPAEAARVGLGFDPLDLRLPHAMMALLHSGYFVTLCWALVRYFGHRWSTLVAFLTAITSFMFFSYGPFISHDLLPGLMFLAMLFWSERLATDPEPRTWLGLVVLGTAAPLVKQTYGVFWIAVIAAHAAPTLLRMDARYRTPVRALAWLAAGAAVSGLITWIVYGLVLMSWAPTVSLWLRPYYNLQYLAHIYDGMDVSFPPWIYLRNVWAYGLLTAVLLAPGLVLSLRGSRLQRRIAIAWIVAIVFVHAMPLREVRYIAFAAPLSAFLIVPAAARLARQRIGLMVMGALLMVDLGGAVREAARIRLPFYQQHPIRALLEPLGDVAHSRRPLFHNVLMLSFAAPGQSPLAADRYHRIFHVGAHHIGVLYERANEDVRLLPLPTASAASVGAPDGSALLFSNTILANSPSWTPQPPPGIDTLFQGVATLESRVYRRGADGVYVDAGGQRLTPGVRHEGAAAVVTLAGDTRSVRSLLMPVAIFSREDTHPLRQNPDGGFVVSGLDASRFDALPETLVIRSFVIQRLTVPGAPPSAP